MIVEGVSSAQDIETEDSPQNLAFTWLVDLDTRYVCPDDPELTQRYVLAVFYYSLNGDLWFKCRAPDDFSNQEQIDDANAECSIPTSDDPTEQLPSSSGSDAWLTPGDECDWMGVVCDNEGYVDWLQMSKSTLGTLGKVCLFSLMF